MGSVLRRASSDAVSSAYQACEFFSAPGSPCRQQEIGLATSAVGTQLTPQQRARMDRHKAVALARRKIKLEQQREEALIRIPSHNSGTDRLASIEVQSPVSSQTLSYYGSTLAGNNVTTEGVTQSSQVESTQTLQLNFYGSDSEHIAQSSQQDKPRDFQCGSLHRTQPSQQDYGRSKHVSVRNMNFANGTQPTQHEACLVSPLTSEQRARMAQEKEKALARQKEQFQQHTQQVQDQGNHNQSLTTLADGSTCTFYFGDSQRDEFVGSSYAQASQRASGGSFLTSDQRARMAQEKEKALARRQLKLQQQQEGEYQSHYKCYMSQCPVADGNLDSRHNVCVSSYGSLTFEQRARMVQEKEQAFVRSKQKLQQQEQEAHQQSHSNFSVSQFPTDDGHIYDVGDDSHGSCSHIQAYSTVSMEEHDFFTPAQKAFVVHHMEITPAKQQENRLCQAQQDAQPMTTQSTLTSTEFLDGGGSWPQSISQTTVQISGTQFEQRCSQWNSPQNSFLQEPDTVCGFTLTHEQRVRMEHQKAMAIVRRNARLGEHQQDEVNQYQHKTHVQRRASR